MLLQIAATDHALIELSDAIGLFGRLEQLNERKIGIVRDKPEYGGGQRVILPTSQVDRLIRAVSESAIPEADHAGIQPAEM